MGDTGEAKKPQSANTDVTQRKLLEEELELKSNLLDYATDSITLTDLDGNYLYVNETASKSLGYSSEELLSMNSRKLVIPEYRDLLSKHIQEIITKGHSNYETARLRKNGTIKFSDVRSRLIESGGKKLILSVNRDVTERKKIDQIKDDFIGMVSHELRSPLTVIIGALNTVLSEDKQLSDEVKHGLLQDATWEADTLSHLLDNLLDLSRAQAQRLQLYTEPIHIGNIVESVADRMRKRYPEHPIIFNIPEHTPKINADRIRIERILFNLIENAVKYSPKGSEVQVFAEPNKDHVTIGIRDFGIGIPSDHLIRLFRPFERIESGSSPAKGVGLGLFVCQKLVEAHGGTLWVESQPGTGSTFFFALPCAPQISEGKEH